MFVSDWMTKKPITVSPDDGLSEAIGILKEKGFKHLPVVKGGRLIGIISDRDIKDFMPSRATSLDIYELHYLLQKVKVKEIMKTKITVTTPDTPIEEASMVMSDCCISCLPVIDNDKLVGIITVRDIFSALVDITGVRHGGHRIYLSIEDKPGSIKDVADIIRKHGFSLQGVLTSYENAAKGMRNVVIRTKGKGDFKSLRAELEAAYRGVRIKKG